ncbi:uncharacterized protein LOC127836422 [Dreissena polymorpha]|uniref:uncharacterized protein LOC127836422 n=1 Tax=Dreissena polymorpha TaxID=45954 RepID=UPI0022656AC7|nr:uncharacterized protein LOC127836422 [Dreissena polymorpha]
MDQPSYTYHAVDVEEVTLGEKENARMVQSRNICEYFKKPLRMISYLFVPIWDFIMFLKRPFTSSSKQLSDRETYVTQLEHRLAHLQNVQDELRRATLEKEDLQTRLSAVMSSKLRDNNPNIADLSDQFRPTKLAEMFSELYDNQWTTAYSTVNRIMYGAERETIDFLLDMFMITNVFCYAEIEDSWQYLTRWFLVEEDKNDAILTKPLKDRRKRGILKHVNYCPQQIEQIVASIGADDRVSHLLSNDDVKAYLLECARLCLLMAASDPPVFVECPGRPDLGLEERVLDVKQRKSSHGISARQTGRNTNGQKRTSGARIQFNKAIFKEYTTRGAFLEYVVWPVMYVNKGGNMLSRGVAQGTGEKTPPLENGPWIWWK